VNLSGNPTFNVANNGSGIGTVNLGALNDGGTARTITLSGAGTVNLTAGATSLVAGTAVNVNNGTLRVGAVAGLGSTAQVNVGASGTLSIGANQTISSLSGSGGVSLGTGAVLTIGSSDNLSSTSYTGMISGLGGLANGGTGTVVLSNGSNSYGGGTTVASGTLRVTNSSGSATGTGNVTLNGGTFASGPAGSISGSVLAGSGSHIVAPGGVGSVGVLSVGGMTTSATTTLNFDLGAPVSGGSYTGDLINIGATGLTVGSGTALSFGTNPTAVGDYRLFSGNFGSPSQSNFTLPSVPGHTLSLSSSVDPGYYDLVVALSSSSGQWNVNNATAQSYNVGSNWDSGGVPNDIGQIAIFGNGASNQVTNASILVTVDAADVVGQLMFTNNQGTSYTIGTDDNVHGPTLNNSNHSGGAVVTVAANIAQQFIDAPLTLADANGTTFNVGANSTLLVSVNGIGQSSAGMTLTKTGTGTLTLDATSTYTGTTTVHGGTLRTSPSGSISSSAVLDATGNVSSTLRIGNSQTLSSLTTLTDAGTGVATLEVASAVATPGSLTFSPPAAGTTTFVGNVQLDSVSGNGGSLIKAGDSGSTLVLHGPTSFRQNSSLHVNFGTLRVAASGTTTVSTGVTATVANGATLELSGGTSALADPTALSSAGPATNPLQRVTVSNAGTLLVDAQAVQQVGGINGAGSVVLADNSGSNTSSLTANSIVQNSLMIGSGATFVLAPSNSSGNPLAGASSDGLVLAGSLTPSSSLANSASQLGVGGLTAPLPTASLGGGLSGSIAAVPEPSTIALLLLGGLATLFVAGRRSNRR
jgi:autotransporter-associated beta strand protein